MAAFKGEFDGLTFRADWGRIGAGRLAWTAAIRNGDGVWRGSPSGMMSVGGSTDAECEVAVHQAIDIAIRDGIGVDRSIDD